MAKYSNSQTLKKNYILYLVFNVLAIVAVSISAAALWTSFIGSIGMGFDAATGASAAAGSSVFVFIVGLVFVGLSVWKGIATYDEIKSLTGEGFFKIYFICKAMAIGMMLLPFVQVLGAIVSIGAMIVEIIAWVKLKDIRKLS